MGVNGCEHGYVKKGRKQQDPHPPFSLSDFMEGLGGKACFADSPFLPTIFLPQHSLSLSLSSFLPSRNLESFLQLSGIFL